MTASRQERHKAGRYPRVNRQRTCEHRWAMAMAPIAVRFCLRCPCFQHAVLVGETVEWRDGEGPTR